MSACWSGFEPMGLTLSLVVCPAGFGKTTMLAAWHQAETARRPVAWLTLDEGDNDPVVLWSYLIEALRQVARPSARPRRRTWPTRPPSPTWCCRTW